MPNRYHGFDALRAIAMILGLVTHAIVPFTNSDVMAILQPDADPTDTPVFWSGLTLWMHQWRMPIFFVLAGFFSEMMIERRGLEPFLLDRGIRLFGTMLVFLTIFWLAYGTEWSSLVHLWFLWVLSVFVAMTVLVKSLGLSRFLRPALWFFERPSRLIILISPLCVLSVYAKQDLTYQIVPHFLPDLPMETLLYYGYFFLLGIGIWYRKCLIEYFSQPSVWIGLLAIGVLASILAAAQLDSTNEFGLLVLLISTLQLAFIFAFLGAANCLVTRRWSALDFFVERAYAIYLFHLTPSIKISSWLYVQGYTESMSIMLGSLLTLCFCLIIYQVFVKYTPLNWVIAGYGKSRFQIATLFGSRAQV